MEQIMNYVKPELIVVAVVLYFIGMGLKQSQTVKDKYIPLILGGISIAICAIYVFATCTCGTGQDIAEVTEGHADRGGHLRQHIDGRHQEDGVQQALQIGEDAVGLYLVVHDDDEHHDGPGRLSVQVCRGAPQAYHTDQVAADAECEDSTHQRDELIEVPAHVVVDELVQPFHDELGGGLPFGDVFQFEVTPQPEGQSREQRHDDPCAHKSLGDLEIAQHRDIGMDGIQDLCAVQFHLLRFTPFVTGSIRLRRGRGGVVLHRDVHRFLRGCKRLVLAGYLQVINGDTGEKQRQHTGKGLEAGGRDGHHHPQRLQQHPAVVGKL